MSLCSKSCPRSGESSIHKTTSVHTEELCVVVRVISGQKIQSSVERMLRIWRERKVYDKAFVKQLDQLLSGSQPEEEGIYLSTFQSGLRDDAFFLFLRSCRDSSECDHAHTHASSRTSA